MKRFASLLTFSPGQNPEAAQKQAQANFANEVRQSRLLLRIPNTPLPQTGICLILGVATYALPELSLLDEIDASLGGGNGTAPTVHVFNVLDCPDMAAFRQYIPGLDTVFETPILALVVNGQIVKQVSGLAAVKDELRNQHLLDTMKRAASATGN
jgi:hypothetical protein